MFEELKQHESKFAERIAEIKERRTASQWGWYPFPIIPGKIGAFDGLLTGANRQLFEDTTPRSIADIGAADGDLAFFLESLGHSVDIFEGGLPGLEAARILKEELDSRASVNEINLDEDFELPRRYDLALLLNTLYHVKNPFNALERLARVADACILSTRIARWIPTGKSFRRRRIDMSDLPLAYLLDAYEANPHDPTNYWIFSEAGLKRLVARAGWTVADFTVYGAVEDSEPASEKDGRAWCLLKSNVTDEVKPGAISPS